MNFKGKTESFRVALTAVFITLSMSMLLTGCQKESEKAKEDNSSSAIKVIEMPASDMSDVGGALESENESAIENDSEIIGNGGYFVQRGNKLYYHVPSEKGLEVAALWREFTRGDCGETLFLETDLDTLETKVLFTDDSYGGMSASGDSLIFGSSDAESGEAMLAGYTFGGEQYFPDVNGGTSYYGGDKEGHYVVGSFYDDGNGNTDDAGSRVVAIKDGQVLGEYNIHCGINYLGVDRNKLFYINTDYSQYDKEISYLMQLNLDDGKIINLGELPESEMGYGSVDQFEVLDNKLYFSYGLYEGTGHFYAGGFYVTASEDVENSVRYDEITIDQELIVSPPFVIRDGRIVEVSGIPGSAAVVGNAIGYYDESGDFVIVSDKDYGSEEIDSGNGTDEITEGRIKEIEHCEKLGNYIYAIQNICERAPEEDVGWRYAYRRLQTIIFRVNIETGDEEVLIKSERGVAKW